MDLTFPWEAPAFAPIFAQRAIELQAVPSIQSLQPPSHEGILGPSAAELLDEAFPRTTAKRKLDLLEGLPSFQLIPKPAVASLRQSTLRHALVSRLLILLKAAGDSCPILALADEGPWMGWQLVSDVVSGRSESTLKARLGYLERWCSDHRLPWVPLTVSATLKGASPSAPTSGYQSLRWFAHMFQCAADADFFSSALLKGSATHSLQAAPPLRQKPAILVSQVKRLGRARLGEHCWGHPRCPLLQVSLAMPWKGSLTSGTPYLQKRRQEPPHPTSHLAYFLFEWMPLVPELVGCEGSPWPPSPGSYHPTTDSLSGHHGLSILQR